MIEVERRANVETIAREAKRLEQLAEASGEGFLAFLLANVQLETARILNSNELDDD
jgi:hypothetical protein